MTLFRKSLVVASLATGLATGHTTHTPSADLLSMGRASFQVLGGPCVAMQDKVWLRDHHEPHVACVIKVLVGGSVTSPTLDLSDSDIITLDGVPLYDVPQSLGAGAVLVAQVGSPYSHFELVLVPEWEPPTVAVTAKGVKDGLKILGSGAGYAASYSKPSKLTAESGITENITGESVPEGAGGLPAGLDAPTEPEELEITGPAEVIISSLQGGGMMLGDLVVASPGAYPLGRGKHVLSWDDTCAWSAVILPMIGGCSELSKGFKGRCVDPHEPMAATVGVKHNVSTAAECVAACTSTSVLSGMAQCCFYGLARGMLECSSHQNSDPQTGGDFFAKGDTCKCSPLEPYIKGMTGELLVSAEVALRGLPQAAKAAEPLSAKAEHDLPGILLGVLITISAALALKFHRRRSVDMGHERLLIA